MTATLTPELIDIKFKAKHRNLARELGHTPMTRDPGYWELSNWYLDAMGKLSITRRIRETDDEMIEWVDEDDGTVWVAREDRKCEVCWELIWRLKDRLKGRWPRRCEDCR